VALSDKPNPVFPFKSLRVIPYQEFSGIQNMSLDLFFSGVVPQTNLPVLRFYGWKPYCLSLGYHQTHNDINFDMLRNEGFEIVRRPTGGSAIFHSEELTYSIIIPKKQFSHHELYELFHFSLTEALNKLGYVVIMASEANPGSYLNHGKDTFACFNRAAKSEIKYKGKKLVGSAQKIFNNSILQHGSIIIGRRHEEIIKFLKADSNEIKSQQIYLKKHAVALNEIKKRDASIFSIAENLVNSLSKNLKINNVFYKYTDSSELKSCKAYYDKVSVKNINI
jgi:lipoyl(octanoyl) transferase